MRRRDLLAGLALAATAAESQQPNPESLYIPAVQKVEDRKFLHDFMDDFSFADLVTAAPSIRITHIPVLLDRKAGQYGTIFGHISKNNPQQQAFDGNAPAVIVFHGPESYISPTWYAKAEAVPTWNFAVAHASGKLRPITDKTALHELLAKLIHKFEGRYPQSTYDFSKLPDNYVYPMIGGIIGFEMQIEGIEGKCKLGQERSEADKESILKHLPTAWHEPTMTEFTAAFYERQKKPVTTAGE
jgi:transcriptional regulator